jgi:hypothetical protein
MMNEWATQSINVRRSTKKRLDKMGKMTYDAMIIKLLDFWDEKHQ